MPAFAHNRQPASCRHVGLDWFANPSGRSLLASESAALARVLAGCPALPWIWMGVPAAAPLSGTRGLRLLHRDDGWYGAVRCRVPLPLANESFGAVFLQHVLDDGHDVQALLDDCARVLAPGGTLWLAALNPWSPYRARWAGCGLRARTPGRWQAALRRAGFSGGSTRLQWLGPHWHPIAGEAGVGLVDRFRGAMALTASKQAMAVIPPTALRQLRWQAGRWPLDAGVERSPERPQASRSAIMPG